MWPTRILSLFFSLILSASASAHEFWIEPHDYNVQPGERIVADLKNGEKFEGPNYGYFERNFTRFDVMRAGQLGKVPGRLGDVPAFDMAADREGLWVVLHETMPARVTYKDWAKFEKFAKHKDFPNVRARHAELGFPEPPFKEIYTRHVKALIAVGNGSGKDRAFGLRTEFVAETNPYDASFNGGMRVRLFHAGKARPNVQVEVFERSPSGQVKISLHRTDGQGRARIPVKTGHEYLFDAVVLQPAPKGVGVVWETLWAGLTFAVPG